MSEPGGWLFDVMLLPLRGAAVPGGIFIPAGIIPEVMVGFADLMVVPVVGVVAARLGLLITGIVALVEGDDEPVRSSHRRISISQPNTCYALVAPSMGDMLGRRSRL